MRWKWSATLAGLVVSLVVTAIGMLVLWHLFGQRALFGFLVLPFLGFGGFRWGGRRERGAAASDGNEAGGGAGGGAGPRVPLTCPRCGHQTWDPLDVYCPRDGSRLV